MNFTDQLADVAEAVFKKDNEIKFLTDELARVKKFLTDENTRIKKVNANLRLKILELKSYKKHES